MIEELGGRLVNLIKKYWYLSRSPQSLLDKCNAIISKRNYL